VSATRKVVAAMVVLGALMGGLLATVPARAEAVAVGKAELVVRSVWGTVDDRRRPVVVDADVYWQELIETGADSAAKMLFLDETTLSIGPQSQVRIDEFVYGGGTVVGRVAIEIGRGIMRFVSGITPSSNYRIRTPNAMIGVRGTDFTVAVDDEGTTNVSVRRGAIEMTAAIIGTSVFVRAGEASSVRGDGARPPADPAPPSPQQAAAAAEVTAMLAIEATGDPAAASAEADVKVLGGSKGQAAAARAATPASQTGADCGGC
jgi:hypothetical protein